MAHSKKGEVELAIENYTKAIERKPDLAEPYYNRGMAFIRLQKWEKAKENLTTAKNMGADIIDSFRNDYESVKDFEQQHNVKLPEDIAAMLTPLQA